MRFTFRAGLFYDVDIHDYVEQDGSLATPERIAVAKDISVQEALQDREALITLKEQHRQRFLRASEGRQS